MSYSMIIVDDEEIIRNGLCGFIEANSDSFHVTATFEDGKDAIEYMESANVDLILTDIKMAEVSGLELAEYARSRHPDTEVVILSGYKEFEYAKKAIEVGVGHYLLKPIKNRDILTLLDELKLRIDEKKKIAGMISDYREMKSTLSERFFADILYGTLRYTRDIAERFELLKTDFAPDEPYCAVMYVCWPEDFMTERWMYGQHGAEMVILNYFEKISEKYHISNIGNDRYVLLSGQNCFEDSVNGFRQWIKENTGFDITAETEYICKGVYELVNYSKFMNGIRDNDKSDIIISERLKLLNTYLNIRMYSEAKHLFADVVYKDTPKNNCISAGSFFAQLNEYLDAGQIFFLSDKACETDINLDALFELLREEFEKKSREEKDIIAKIKNYVNDNYMKDITMETIARSVYLQSSYMSRYFKQQTGYNFSDYLLDVRMSNAIKLLRSNRYKIYEISAMVGYQNSKYFSKQFKAYTGYTPKNYCREIWHLNIDK